MCSIDVDVEFFFALQDFPGDDFKSQGSHVAYNVADFSMQVCFLLFYIF